jgi:hypothetical protein
MRKIKIYLLSLVVGTAFLGSACAFASGYPFAVIVNGDTSIIVVGKFASGSGQFTQAEAQNLSVSVAGLVQSLLSGSSVSAPTVLTPSQLASIGFGDADSDINLIKSSYKGAGFDVYVVVNISKTPQYVAGFGPNMRVDVSIADQASLVGVSAPYLYVASIEVPLLFASLLQ